MHACRRFLGTWVLVLAGSLGGTFNAQAANLNVPGQYPSIQAAVNEASSGDTIIIAAGTYQENVSLDGKNLTITGAGNGSNPQVDTIVDGSQSGSVFAVAGGVTVTFQNMTIQNGSASSGGGILNSGTITLVSCIIAGNSAAPIGAGGGLCNLAGGSATLTRCAIANNSVAAQYAAGGIENDPGGMVTLTDCAITGNSGTYGAGIENGGTLSLTNCAVTGNYAPISSDGQGGGIENDGGTVTLTDCILAGNATGEGGGLITEGGGTATLTNCTFAGNSAIQTYGGGLENGSIYGSPGSTVTLTNCILWEDTGGEIVDQPSSSPGTTAVTFSDVQGGFAGTGNLNADPLFVRNPFTNSSGDFGDLHLQIGSPGINAGDDSVITVPPFLTSNGVIIDLNGNPRIVNGIVDMGAYESQHTAFVLTKLTLTPTTVVGSKTATGKITLSAPAPANGAPISVTSTDAAASVPAIVTVPAGATGVTFTITTTAVTAATTGKVVASFAGVSKSASLKVQPIGVQALTIVPNPILGGYNTIGVVTLEAIAAPGDITVTLSSSNPSVASPDATLIIPAGEINGAFNINTTAVSSTSYVTIYATVNGITKSKTLKVVP